MKFIRLFLAVASLVVVAGPSASGQTSNRPAAVVPPARPILPADRVTERRATLVKLRAAEVAGDLNKAAEINAGLAHEAWSRALRVAVAWEPLRDPETALIPRDQIDPLWNGEDTGSDCWPFLFLAAHDLKPSREAFWLEAIASDRKLCGVLPKKVRFKPTRVEETTLQEQLFGGAEYIKDGLLFLTERMGRGPWFDRMDEIAGVLVSHAQTKSKRGVLPGPDTEINGDMLVLLSRLYWATKNPVYLEMAQRIADVYLLDVFPVTGGMPPLYWDFEKNGGTGHPNSLRVKYRDHGNETIFGLTELYFLEKRLGLEAAERHRLPIRAMLDKMLVHGRTPEGLWCNSTRLFKGGGDNGIADNWGYVLNAFQTFDLTENTFRYTLEIQRAMLAASRMKSFQWERRPMDGYADALEGMMYMLPWYDLTEARNWVDDEFEIMFGFQQPDGIVEMTYLDGNFIRSALLYARYKTLGVSAEPWRDDLRIGSARDMKTGRLVVHISAASPWKGLVKFDGQRHKEIWGMPENYPRLNAAPEWFVAPATAKFSLAVSGGAACEVSGGALVAGVPVELEPNAPQIITIVPAATNE